MNADPTQKPGFFSRAVRIHENQTGQPALAWALIALCNLAVQLIFYHAMAGGPIHGMSAGEFGTLNAALGIIGLLTVPLLAVHLAFRFYPSRPQAAGEEARLNSLRASALTVTETFAWLWGGFCFVLIFLPLPLPYLPRFSLQLLAFMNVLLALGGVIGWAACQSDRQLRSWTMLLVGAALARVLIGAGLMTVEPWADSGLAVFLIAGFITLVPALRLGDVGLAARLKACRAVFDRDFLLFAGATFSVLLGIYLFTNADRIVALGWMDILPGRVVMSTGTQAGFDHYQAAGLLGRALLWGTQPLLWILFAQRSRLDRTNAASLTFFWIYLGALVSAAFLLGCLAEATGGFFPSVEIYVPTFAAVMVPLGVLQGLGIFSLASRRYPECFVLGACGLAYALVLLFIGRRPELMLPCMFGGGVVSLMVVLFVGVVRWGRKQP